MDGPLGAGCSDGYGASYHLPIIASNFNDPGLDTLLECFYEGDNPDSQNSVNEITRSAPLELKLPPQPLRPADMPPSAPLIMPSQPLPPELAVPVILPHQQGAANVVPSHPQLHPDVPSYVLPIHLPRADAAPHPIAPSMLSNPHIIIMPPQHQPPPHPNFNTHEFSAYANAIFTSPQSHHPLHQISFTSLSGVEANHKDQLLIPYDSFYDASTFRSMPMHQYDHCLQTSVELELPALEVPTSPIFGSMASGSGTFLADMQHSPLSMVADSDSAAMEIPCMSTYSVAPGPSNASLNWPYTPPQGASFSLPPSPTPSVNKRASANGKTRSSTHGTSISKVSFKVKTNLLSLNDGYAWRKYGEKNIKDHKYRRLCLEWSTLAFEIK